MSAPEDSGLGDPYNVGPDGVRHREEEHIPDEEVGPEEQRPPSTCGRFSLLDDYDDPIKGEYYSTNNIFLNNIGIGKRKEKTVDGSGYVEDAFGGFGPGSPEYDPDRRLTITIPNPKAAVGWFTDVEVNPDENYPTKISFSASVSNTRHPGVRTLEVRFAKTGDISLVTGRVLAHRGALSVPTAPERDGNGVLIDTKTPAKIKMARHMLDRLNALYGEKLRASKDAQGAVIEVGDGIDLYVELADLPTLAVTPNGNAFYYDFVRYGTARATPRQLERELLALQQHFPQIAEAYADFFRAQLPKSMIEVDYKNPKSEGGSAQDPVNPQRLAMLRRELVTEPRGDDFKYIGGLEADIAKLKQAAMGFSHPEAFREFGVAPPRGILLQGPPGTGKTSLAMAFARDAEAVVLTLKASTIKSAFHGETERNIRGAFALVDELVAEGKKVVVFIDEIEALAPARDSMGSSGIDKNVTAELLQGMNVDRKNCIIIAATNVPGMVDPALLNNSSRFSEQLEIGLPDTKARSDIIHKLFLKFTDKSTGGSQEALFDPAIDVDTLAVASEGLSGADIENAIRKVMFTKAVMLASTGVKPGPATNGEIYQSIKSVIIGKEKTGRNYL